MKKHRVIYPRNSRQAKALQRWAELWKSNPEQMERRRKRGNEANARKWLGEKETARYYLAAQPSKLTPDQAKAFCIRVVNESRGRSKMSPGRCESVRKRFSGWGLWAFDFNEGVYLNHPRIEADRRRAEQAEAERLEKMDRAEAYRIEAERNFTGLDRLRPRKLLAGEKDPLESVSVCIG